MKRQDLGFNPVFTINKKTTKSQNKDQKKTTISWKKRPKKDHFRKKKRLNRGIYTGKNYPICIKHAYGNLLGIHCLNFGHHLPTLEIQ